MELKNQKLSCVEVIFIQDIRRRGILTVLPFLCLFL